VGDGVFVVAHAEDADRNTCRVGEFAKGDFAHPTGQHRATQKRH
jgi:hypothetical protein